MKYKQRHSPISHAQPPSPSQYRLRRINLQERKELRTNVSWLRRKSPRYFMDFVLFIVLTRIANGVRPPRFTHTHNPRSSPRLFTQADPTRFPPPPSRRLLSCRPSTVVVFVRALAVPPAIFETRD